jgi:hypothetical protein
MTATSTFNTDNRQGATILVECINLLVSTSRGGILSHDANHDYSMDFARG